MIEWRAAKAYAHVHAEQQHYLLFAHFNHNSDSRKATSRFRNFFDENFWPNISPSLWHPNYPKGIWLEFWVTAKDFAFYWHRRLHSKQKNSSSFTFHLPVHAIREGEAEEEFHIPFTEPWIRHDSIALADSYLCYFMEPTELLITTLLNKLGVLETQDTPRTSMHVGNIYLPTFLPPSSWQEPSLSHGYTYREAPVNTLITNFIMRGNLLTPSCYLLTGHTLKHPVLKAPLCFNLFSYLFSNPLDKGIFPSPDIHQSSVFSGMTNAYSHIMPKYKHMYL